DNDDLLVEGLFGGLGAAFFAFSILGGARAFRVFLSHIPSIRPSGFSLGLSGGIFAAFIPDDGARSGSRTDQFLILYDLAYDIGNLVAYDYALAVVQNQRRVGLGFYGFDLIRVYDEVFSVQFGHFYHGGFTSLPFYLTGSRDFNAHA